MKLESINRQRQSSEYYEVSPEEMSSSMFDDKMREQISQGFPQPTILEDDSKRKHNFFWSYKKTHDDSNIENDIKNKIISYFRQEILDLGQTAVYMEIMPYSKFMKDGREIYIQLCDIDGKIEGKGRLYRQRIATKDESGKLDFVFETYCLYSADRAMNEAISSTLSPEEEILKPGRKEILREFIGNHPELIEKVKPAEVIKKGKRAKKVN